MKEESNKENERERWREWLGGINREDGSRREGEGMERKAGGLRGR